jgi:hypothetical protein
VDHRFAHSTIVPVRKLQWHISLPPFMAFFNFRFEALQYQLEQQLIHLLFYPFFFWIIIPFFLTNGEASMLFNSCGPIDEEVCTTASPYNSGEFLQ